MANVPRGERANNEIQPLQTEFMWIEGSPEGVDFAPAGSFRIDRVDGSWWRKLTTSDHSTGWETFAAGSGALIGIGPPSGVAADGTMYTDRVDSSLYYYDAINVAWVKYPSGAGGGGVTADVINPPPSPNQPWLGLPGDYSQWQWNVANQTWIQTTAPPPPFP